MRRAAAFLTLLVLLGCKGPTPHLTAAPPATLASGWESTSNASYGVTLGVPPGWKPGLGSAMQNMGLGDMGADSGGTTNEAAQAVQQSLKKSEDAEAKREQASLEQQGILVACSNGSRMIPGEEQTRFYVKLDKNSAGADLNGAAQALKREMMGHDPVPVETAMGKSLFVKADYSSKGGDKIHERGYVFVDGENVFQLRFITTGEAQPIDSIYEDVMKSLRIKPGAAQ